MVERVATAVIIMACAVVFFPALPSVALAFIAGLLIGAASAVYGFFRTSKRAMNIFMGAGMFDQMLRGGLDTLIGRRLEPIAMDKAVYGSVRSTPINESTQINEVKPIKEEVKPSNEVKPINESSNESKPSNVTCAAGSVPIVSPVESVQCRGCHKPFCVGDAIERSSTGPWHLACFKQYACIICKSSVTEDTKDTTCGRQVRHFACYGESLVKGLMLLLTEQRQRAVIEILNGTFHPNWHSPSNNFNHDMLSSVLMTLDIVGSDVKAKMDSIKSGLCSINANCNRCHKIRGIFDREYSRN